MGRDTRKEVRIQSISDNLIISQIYFRSSQAFIAEVSGTESEIQGAFKVLLQSGVRVRKHERGHYAEPIRLSTSKGGVKNKDKNRSSDASVIYWEPEVSTIGWA
jgi:hypothetical protein